MITPWVFVAILCLTFGTVVSIWIEDYRAFDSACELALLIGFGKFLTIVL